MSNNCTISSSLSIDTFNRINEEIIQQSRRLTLSKFIRMGIVFWLNAGIDTINALNLRTESDFAEAGKQFMADTAFKIGEKECSVNENESVKL